MYDENIFYDIFYNNIIIKKIFFIIILLSLPTTLSFFGVMI